MAAHFVRLKVFSKSFLLDRLRPSRKWPVCQQVYSSYCTNCHVHHALFVNGHRLPTIINVRELDVIVPWPCFESLAHLESLVWPVLQVTQVRTPPLTSSYPGQAQSCPIVNGFSLINCSYTWDMLFLLGASLCMWMHGQSDRCWTAIAMDFNTYWSALPTGG